MVRKRSNIGKPNIYGHNPVCPKKTMKCTFEEVRDALIQCHGLKWAAADKLDINPSTLSGYFLRWPRLKKYVRVGKTRVKDRVISKLYEIAFAQTVDGNPIPDIPWAVQLNAIKFYLSRQGGPEWMVTKIIKDERTDTKNIPLPAALAPDERLKLLDEVRKQMQVNINLNLSSAPESLPEPVVPLPASVPQLLAPTCPAPTGMAATLPVTGVVIDNTPLENTPLNTIPASPPESETSFSI